MVQLWSTSLTLGQCASGIRTGRKDTGKSPSCCGCWNRAVICCNGITLEVAMCQHPVGLRYPCPPYVEICRYLHIYIYTYAIYIYMCVCTVYVYIPCKCITRSQWGLISLRRIHVNNVYRASCFRRNSRTLANLDRDAHPIFMRPPKWHSQNCIYITGS